MYPAVVFQKCIEFGRDEVVQPGHSSFKPIAITLAVKDRGGFPTKFSQL